MQDQQSLPLQLAMMGAGATLAALLGPMVMDGATDSMEVFESAGRWLTSPLGYISTLGTLAASTAMSYTRLLGIPRRVVVRDVPRVKYKWSVPIGRTKRGRWVYHNFDTFHHAKVAGVTGSGKSICMKSLVGMLAMLHKPSEAEFVIIDLKGGATFAPFARLPHVRGVYWDYESVTKALEACKREVEERLQRIYQARYNFETPYIGHHVFVVIDEGGELAPTNASDAAEKELRKACMAFVSYMARIGREPGYHLIFGTQRPDHYTLPTSIRGQLEATFCFRVENELDAEIVLRRKLSAELLPHIPGRMIYKTPRGETEVQGVYVPDDVLEAWIRSFETVPSRGVTRVVDAPYIEVLHRGRTIRVDNVTDAPSKGDTSSDRGVSGDWWC